MSLKIFFNRNNASRLDITQIPNPCGLINYWPFNGNYDDVIGGANLFGGQSFSLSANRNGMISSALELQSNGYLQAPTGVYFNGDFSVTFWFYLLDTPGQYSRVFDFGNGESSDNIYLSYNNNLMIGYFNGDTSVCSISSSQNPNINTWYFVGFVLSSGKLTIYFNGVSSIDSFSNNFKPINISRKNNYIGKSNWPDLQVHQKIDDLKFFNRALNITEIASEKASNFSCNIFN